LVVAAEPGARVGVDWISAFAMTAALLLTRGNYQLVIAGGFYGATLLYGTRLLPQLAVSSEALG